MQLGSASEEDFSDSDSDSRLTFLEAFRNWYGFIVTERSHCRWNAVALNFMFLFTGTAFYICHTEVAIIHVILRLTSDHRYGKCH